MPAPTRLYNRDFLLLWQGQLISKLGNQAHYIAVMFWIKHATGSATLMGTIMMLATLPMVLLAPIAGAFADRHSRRGIIAIADLVSGVAVMTLVGLLFWIPDQTATIITALMVTSVIVGTSASFFSPAFSAAIPDLVPKEKLAAANSMNRFSDQFAGLIGMSAAGVLFKFLGAPLLFFFDALSFIYSGISSLFAKVPMPIVSGEKAVGAKQQIGQLLNDMKEGLRYAWSNVGLRNLMLLAAALNFFFSPIGVLLPFLVEDHLHASTDWFGYILGALGAGALVGLLAVGTLKLNGRPRSFAVISGVVVMCALFGALGLTHTPLQALVLAFFAGMLNSFVNVSIGTIMALTTPSAIRGRVFGLLTTLSAGLMPISMGLTGVVVDLMNKNVPLIILLCGGIGTVLCLALSINKEFRQFLAYDASPRPS
jgi:DHA3 family macrolide efflux protein-like MFS transporter